MRSYVLTERENLDQDRNLVGYEKYELLNAWHGDGVDGYIKFGNYNPTSLEQNVFAETIVKIGSSYPTASSALWTIDPSFYTMVESNGQISFGRLGTGNLRSRIYTPSTSLVPLNATTAIQFSYDASIYASTNSITDAMKVYFNGIEQTTNVVQDDMESLPPWSHMAYLGIYYTATHFPSQIKIARGSFKVGGDLPSAQDLLDLSDLTVDPITVYSPDILVDMTNPLTDLTSTTGIVIDEIAGEDGTPTNTSASELVVF